MKKIVLGVLAGVVSLNVSAQVGYTVKGEIGKLDKPAKAFLLIHNEGKVQVDSTFIINGKFEFRGTVSSPMEATLRVKHDGIPDAPGKRSGYDVKALIIANENITLVAKDSIAHALVSGSPLNAENDKVSAYLKPIYAKYDALNEEYKQQPEAKKQDKDYIQTLESRAQGIKKEVFDAKMAYIQNNPDKFMGLEVLNSILVPEFDAIAMEKIFARFDQALRNTYLGKMVDEKIQKEKKTQEGVEAPAFSQPDVNGTMVKLSDYRGKYVLLDFWASWCAPCRRENPNLVKTYAQYKARGFEILGVSLDKPGDKEKWLKAIQTDGLTWTQTSDLKGWDNEAATLYEVKAIPMNFLIDPTGKIVAKDLRGEKLNQKLEAIFGNKP